MGIEQADCCVFRLQRGPKLPAFAGKIGIVVKTTTANSDKESGKWMARFGI
jgi:hypothetical protein